MRPDTQPDTWSPWYEAFTPQAQHEASMARPAGAGVEPAEASAPSDRAETDSANQALFDCYNG